MDDITVVLIGVGAMNTHIFMHALFFHNRSPFSTTPILIMPNLSTLAIPMFASARQKRTTAI